MRNDGDKTKGQQQGMKGKMLVEMREIDLGDVERVKRIYIREGNVCKRTCLIQSFL